MNRFAIVERNGIYPYANLTGAWLWNRFMNEFEILAPETEAYLMAGEKNDRDNAALVNERPRARESQTHS
jgi:hypothetical protein